MQRPVERVVDLLDPALNEIRNLEVEEARRLLFDPDPAAVRGIAGAFALVARDGIAVRMARSLDRPLRYFLAKRQAGPALFVADRIDALRRALAAEGLEGQFHPSYTRMVPAHHVIELRLVGCPDPDPTYARFFAPERGVLPPDLDEIGRRQTRRRASHGYAYRCRSLGTPGGFGVRRDRSRDPGISSSPRRVGPLPRCSSTRRVDRLS